MCQPTLISSKGGVSVTECHECNMINIWKAGVVITLSNLQFHAFTEATKHLVFDDHLEYAPDGTEIVIMATPYTYINLVFTREELQEFFSALREGKYMQQVYRLLNSSED